MSAPPVSIGLPVYNGEDFIAQSVESLLAQTWSDFELVVSDNASTDGTEAILREFAARDERIRYIRQPQNRGAVWNANEVFRQSKARLFRWGSHDDYSAPEHVELCVRALEAAPDAVLAYTGSRFVDKDGRHLFDDALPEALGDPDLATRYDAYLRECQGPCNFPYGMIRADVLRQTPLYADHRGSDHDFMLELLLHGRFVAAPGHAFHRRWYPESGGHLSGAEAAEHLAGEAQPSDDLELYEWRALRYRWKTLERSPLDAEGRRTIRRLLLRHARWGRDVLIAELWRYAKATLSGHGRAAA